MEKKIKVKTEYNSLDKILDFAKKESPYECLKDYDIWEVRTDANGQMEQCVVIKKSAMHGLKIFFQKDGSLKMTYIIPNKTMNALFGKSQKARRNILEVMAEQVKEILLANPRQQAFGEIGRIFYKIAA